MENQHQGKAGNEQRDPNAQQTPHENPQNASGKPGKEFSSEQQDPLYDQSEESIERVNQQPNGEPQNGSFPQDQANKQNDQAPNKSDTSQNRQFDEKQPVDRPAKEEDQELL